MLLLGEGHGRFLRELVTAPGEREVLVVDGSAGMLQQARRIAEGASSVRSRVEFRHADVLAFDCAERFDAVITHFFLDCFTRAQLGLLIPKIGSWVKPGGCWQIADFQVPRQKLFAWRARFVLALAYRFFRVFTSLPAHALVPPQPWLLAHGLERTARHEFNFGLLYSELWHRPCAAVLPSGQ